MIESEEDWFYDSIHRYKNLNMFELEYPIHCVEATNWSSICVSCSNKKRHQLLELSLPAKLTSQANDVSEVVITSDTDLKIKCGSYTHAMADHVKTSCSDRNVIVSHLNTKGVSIYQLSSDNSDEIKKYSMLKCGLECPSISLSGSELVLAKDTVSPVLVMDINTGQVVKEVSCDHLQSTTKEAISPVRIGDGLVALCHQSSGRVQLYDSKEFQIKNSASIAGETDGKLWSFTSLFECSEKSTNKNSVQPTCIAMVSNEETLKLYDPRNWSIPFINKNLEIKSSQVSTLELKFKPWNKHCVSVSGFDANVYVYELGSETELVFVHDGHRHVEGFNPQTVTSSHVWSPDIDNLVISSADNGTIQAWQFEDRRKLCT